MPTVAPTRKLGARELGSLRRNKSMLKRANALLAQGQAHTLCAALSLAKYGPQHR